MWYKVSMVSFGSVSEHLAMLCPNCHLLYIKFLFIKLFSKSNITLEVMLSYWISACLWLIYSRPDIQYSSMTLSVILFHYLPYFHCVQFIQFKVTCMMSFDVLPTDMNKRICIHKYKQNMLKNWNRQRCLRKL